MVLPFLNISTVDWMNFRQIHFIAVVTFKLYLEFVHGYFA